MPPEPEVTSPSLRNSGPATVLAVDDEPDLLDIVAIALADAGFDCVTSSCAEQALTRLESEPAIDVVISDVRMPGMDGVGLLETVRSRFPDRGFLQFLFLSAHATVDTTISAMRLSAADFLLKPINRNELIGTVRASAMKARNGRARLEAWQSGQRDLREVGQELRDLVRLFLPINEPATIAAAEPPKPAEPEAMEPLPADRMLELLRLRDVRLQHFRGRLFADPVLSMLLHLMEQTLRSRPTYLADLCHASNVSMSTATRRIGDLEAMKLLTRRNDTQDARRQRVMLTPKGQAQIAAFLSELDCRLARIAAL